MSLKCLKKVRVVDSNDAESQTRNDKGEENTAIYDRLI